jgi:hypothetical protein
MFTLSRINQILTIVALGAFVSSCSAKFGLVSTTTNSSDNSQSKNTKPQEPDYSLPIVCDPFSENNIVNSTQGLKGFLYHDPSQPSLWGTPEFSTSSQQYLKESLKVAELELSSVNVPGRYFEFGFTTNSGSLLAIDDVPMTEWFALSVASRLRITEPGKYQFSLLSDDGATLKVKYPDQEEYQTFIDNEGIHPPKLKVSDSVLDFSTGTESYPINLSFYQGPRFNIALMLMMRKINDVSAPGALFEPLNLLEDFEAFWITYATYPSPAVATQNYQQLLDNGWTPVPSQYFELQSGFNRCSQ